MAKQRTGTGRSSQFVDDAPGSAHAANVVVDPGGTGDATTIAAGVALLPAAGGRVYVRTGTYAVSSTIALPDADTEIIGAGKDSVTITYTGASPLFTTGGNNSYVIQGMTVNGDTTPPQNFIESGTAEVVVERVDITATNIIVDATGDLEAMFTNCHISMPSNSSNQFWDNVASGPPGELTWNCVDVVIATANTFSWIGSPSETTLSPEFHVINSYIGGGGPINTRITSSEYNIQWFNVDSVDFEVGGPDSYISGLIAVDTSISVFLGAPRTMIVDSNFSLTQDIGGNGTFSIVSINDADCRIEGCQFNLADIGSSICIDVDDVNGSRCVIVGNVMRQFGFHGVRAGGSECVIRGNVFDVPVGATSAISDVDSDGSDYGGNTGISGLADLNISTAATNLAYNGVRRKRVAGGTTTGSPVSQAIYENETGVIGTGTIKNTGGDSMVVRETVSDLFLDSVSVDTVVVAGDELQLDPHVKKDGGTAGTASPPFESYEVLVFHTGTATTFDLEMGMVGH